MYDPIHYNNCAVKAERTVRYANDMLAHHGVVGRIDEVALLWANAAELDSFLVWAVEGGGMEHFNSVPADEMVRVDNKGLFMVRFEFLRMKGMPWRIEAMCVLDGEAPLHATHLDVMGNGCVVHASYKLACEEEYETSKDVLLEADLDMCAEYENSYGRFSYWRDFDSLFYFKPRINLRDQLSKALDE